MLRFIALETSPENKNKNRQLILLVLANLTDYNPRRNSNRLNILTKAHICIFVHENKAGVKYVITSLKRATLKTYVALNWPISL